MPAEANLIKEADLAKVRIYEYLYKFNDDFRKLLELLSVDDVVYVPDGTVVKAYKTTGTLESGVVAEGELIPLSHYETQEVPIGEITLKKWRKATSAEAIKKKGYEQAVEKTDLRMLGDVKKGIKAELVSHLATGTGVAAGATFQACLAQIWGQLEVKYEDVDYSPVFFMNPLDVADYLSSANITLQTAFGMTYVENFLGLGTTIFLSDVPKGKAYGTAKQNISVFAVNAGEGGLKKAFDFVTDSTGLVGVHENPDYKTMTFETEMLSGILPFAERLDGVVVGTIGA